MRNTFPWFLAFVVLGACAVQTSRAGDADDELKKLQGTWTIIDEDMYGKSQLKDPDRSIKLMVAGDSLIFLSKRDQLDYIYKIHNVKPSATPSSADLTMRKDEKDKGEFLAVYKLDGDELELCWWGKENGKARPEKIGTGAGLVFMKLKRVK